MSPSRVFGVDVGGSGIKGSVVDASSGELVVPRHRIPTPQPSTPQAVAETVAAVVAHHGWPGPVGVTVPGVVKDGVVLTAANIDASWIGTNAENLIAATTGAQVRVLNDADAAGLAEMRYGSAQGANGEVILLTFGTGIGSAMFLDGELLPNSELGHLEFKGMIAERYCAARLVEREEMELEPWARRVGEYLRYLERVLTPDLFIFGGGISKRFDDFAEHLDVTTPVRVAELRNNAGIVGAAIATEPIVR